MREFFVQLKAVVTYFRAQILDAQQHTRDYNLPTHTHI